MPSTRSALPPLPPHSPSFRPRFPSRLRSIRATRGSFRAVVAALAVATALASAGTLVGCKITSSDVEHWKRTQLGPTKLASLVASRRYGPDLRADALLALATMDRTDVQPVEAFSASLDALVAAHDPAFDAIVTALVPDLEVAMRGGERPTRVGQAPGDQQSNAKDAAFVLARHTAGASHDRLVRSLMGWFAADFARRSMAGRHNADEVARAFGASAATLLIPALDAKLDRDAIAKIASIVAAVGDDTAKRAAGERLVAIEREMRSQAFFDWIKGEVRRAMSVGIGGADAGPTDARVFGTATLTREGLLTGGAIAGMKFLASVPAVTARLLEIAAEAPPANAPTALGTMLQDRRVHALDALTNAVGAGHVAPLLAIALNAQNPGNVREGAFDRLAETRSAAAIEPMWPLVGTPGIEGDAAAQRQARVLRARAAELVLQIGGAAKLADLYAHLPADPTTPFEPAELEGYAARLAALTPPPAQVTLRADLQSPIWWRRVVAIHFIAKSGTAADIATLERLGSDSMPTVGPGWAARDPAQSTVGKVASAALESLRERLAVPAPVPAAPTPPVAPGAPAAPAAPAPAPAPAAPAPSPTPASAP